MFSYRVFEATVDGELVHFRMDLIGPNWLVQCIDPKTEKKKFENTISENDEDDALRLLVQELVQEGKSVKAMRQIASENQ